MKIVMSYSIGKDVSTVVRPCPEELSEETRWRIAYDLMTRGTSLTEGDIWNGHEVTDKPYTVFFLPSFVSYIEG